MNYNQYTTRWQRWKIAFEDGRGPLFYAVAACAAGAFYFALVVVLSIGP